MKTKIIVPVLLLALIFPTQGLVHIINDIEIRDSILGPVEVSRDKTLTVSGSLVGDLTLEQNSKAVISGSVCGNVMVNGGALMNSGSIAGNVVNNGGYVQNSGSISGRAFGQVENNGTIVGGIFPVPPNNEPAPPNNNDPAPEPQTWKCYISPDGKTKSCVDPDAGSCRWTQVSVVGRFKAWALQCSNPPQQRQYSVGAPGFGAFQY